MAGSKEAKPCARCHTVHKAPRGKKCKRPVADNLEKSGAESEVPGSSPALAEATAMDRSFASAVFEKRLRALEENMRKSKRKPASKDHKSNQAKAAAVSSSSSSSDGGSGSETGSQVGEPVILSMRVVLSRRVLP